MPYFIGIDGGGTKTEAVVLPSEGEFPVTSFTGSPTNPHAVTRTTAEKELGRIMDEIFSRIPLNTESCAGICLGLAGVDQEEERQAILHYLSGYQEERGISFPVSLRSEAEIGLMAALHVPYGTLAISGTGSGVFTHTPDGQRLRAGGWGHILGDEGSGYRIGQLTLQAVMKSYDRIYPPTLLTNLILEAYGLARVSDLKSYIYSKHIQKQHIAAFAEICIQAAQLDDAIALQIIRSQAQELAETTSALLARQEQGNGLQEDVVVSGSIFTHSKLFYEAYRSSLLKQFPLLRFHRAGQSPAIGAALLARKLFYEAHIGPNPQ